jgi:hypothetical protein
MYSKSTKQQSHPWYSSKTWPCTQLYKKDGKSCIQNFLTFNTSEPSFGRFINVVHPNSGILFDVERIELPRLKEIWVNLKCISRLSGKSHSENVMYCISPTICHSGNANTAGTEHSSVSQQWENKWNLGLLFYLLLLFFIIHLFTCAYIV